MNNEPSNGNRPRRQSTLVFGAAKTGKDDTEELLTADANLVASGVSKDATCEQLKEFIMNKGITVTDIELISLAPQRRTNTFQVAIKIADFDKAMDPNVWLYRVGVQRFRPHRPKQGTWAAQSAQSGGNVQAGSTAQSGPRYGNGAHYQHGGHHAPHHSGRDQYAQPSAPAAQEFHLETQNRFNGLGEENN